MIGFHVVSLKEGQIEGERAVECGGRWSNRVVRTRTEESPSTTAGASRVDCPLVALSNLGVSQWVKLGVGFVRLQIVPYGKSNGAACGTGVRQFRR